MPKFPHSPGAPLLTADEVAGVLGVHRSTVIRLVHSGELVAAVQLPGRTGAFLFRPSDVKAVERQLGKTQ